MTAPLRRMGLALPLALLLVSAPADAQRNERSRGETWTSINDENGRRTELRSHGNVEFSDQGDWVVGLGPGAYLVAAESGRGTDRRIEFRPGEGGVRIRCSADGDERPLDAAGRAWARGMIGRAVREGGLGAERRVAGIRVRGGVNAVLQEIARMRTDSGRRAYYGALLGSGRLSDGEFARLMEDVARRMSSDTETRLVLSSAVDQAEGPARLAALLSTAAEMDSDTETRLVLNRVADRHPLAHEPSRRAFLRAVDGIGSDTERRLVLNAVAEQRLADAGERGAFFRAVDDIRSDTERRLVLSSVLDERPSRETVVAAIQSAGGMRSDVEKRLVLGNVPRTLLRDRVVVAAYRRVVEGMHSETERRLARGRLPDGAR